MNAKRHQICTQEGRFGLLRTKFFPYESFLTHRESFDHDDFCTALHIRIKDKHSCYFMCPFIKIILTDLWIT